MHIGFSSGNDGWIPSEQFSVLFVRSEVITVKSTFTSRTGEFVQPSARPEEAFGALSPRQYGDARLYGCTPGFSGESLLAEMRARASTSPPPIMSAEWLTPSCLG